MDRLEAMRVFVAALDEGSLARAAQRIGRSPASVTRAISFLEEHVGVRLLHRTTRKITLTEQGEQYASVCRRVLEQLDQVEALTGGQIVNPSGLLTITAPVMFGTHLLRPIVGEFLKSHPLVSINYLLLDRLVDLIDEGVDVALRIAPLPDSTLIAIRIGEVRRVLCASPNYLANKPPIKKPEDLANHDCIEITHKGPTQVWNFPPVAGSKFPRSVTVNPRFMVNADQSAADAAVNGEGLVRILSYKVANEIQDGRLTLLLAEYEPPSMPVHLIIPEGRLAIAKVRAFVDFASSRLKAELTRINKVFAEAGAK
ncbi:MAG: LysR family transcriptional regulator [Chitinophagales bacterium]|nr:LysR family transcriptional regulator [Hyphomicrobiales bacterium]